MFSSLSSNLVFSTIEYFSYLNLWLIILFLFLVVFFLIFSSCQLVISSILCSGAVFEFSLIFVCFLFVVIIISPALIILLDSEIIIIPSFIVYSCGYQWAWTFSFYYLNWISNCDHYLFSSYYLCFDSFFLSKYSKIIKLFILYDLCLDLMRQIGLSRLVPLLITTSIYSPLLSIYSTSLHSLLFINVVFFILFYLFGIKIDAIPIRAWFSFDSSFFRDFFIWIEWIDRYIYMHDSLFILVFFILFHYLIPFVFGTCITLYNALIFVGFYIVSFIDILFNNSIKDLSDTTYIVYLNDLSSLNTYLFYFFTCNTTIIIPILSTIRFFVFSYDVIHSLGIYSFGIKIDAIPGRFNFTSIIRTLTKGAHYGYCYELCGHGHSSMLIILKSTFRAILLSALFYHSLL